MSLSDAASRPVDSDQAGGQWGLFDWKEQMPHSESLIEHLRDSQHCECHGLGFPSYCCYCCLQYQLYAWGCLVAAISYSISSKVGIEAVLLLLHLTI